jgi:hypothetical protein
MRGAFLLSRFYRCRSGIPCTKARLLVVDDFVTMFIPQHDQQASRCINVEVLPSRFWFP